MNEMEKYLLMSSVASQMDSAPRHTEYFSVYSEIADDFERFILNTNDDETRNAIRELFGSEPSSKLKKAASFIVNMPMQAVVDYSLTSLALGDLQSFVLWADIATGISIVGGGLITSEIGVAGTIADNIELISDSLASSGVHFGAVEGAQTYLDLRDFTLPHSDLLIKDPSGYLTVDSIVNFLAEELSKSPDKRVEYVPHVEQPDFVLRGARMGAAFYKKTYQAIK